MADLTATPLDPCCGAEQQAKCCEPSEKAACCATSATGGSCGCAAGASDAGTAAEAVVEADGLRERVRDRYAAAAQAVRAGSAEGCACGPASTLGAGGEQVFGAALYAEDAAAAGAAAAAGVANVRFVKGYIEDIPLPAQSVDVVISNCVINLAADKRRVLAEVARVLRPGGRFAVSDASPIPAWMRRRGPTCSSGPAASPAP